MKNELIRLITELNNTEIIRILYVFTVSLIKGNDEQGGKFNE